ncbi:hypothetical protein GTY54_50600 [Streptomyces sp. SID625]|nr:hypothetical protein [Streptomyces sp. SID625]
MSPVTCTARVDVTGEDRNGGTAEITLTHGDDGEFSLSAALHPALGGVDQATAQELAHAAHQIVCVY